MLFGAVCGSLAAEGKDGEALEKIFQGVLCNTIDCLDVNFSSSRLETFSEIALNVTGDDGGSSGKDKGGGKSGRPGTVEFALERYFEDELLRACSLAPCARRAMQHRRQSAILRLLRRRRTK